MNVGGMDMDMETGKLTPHKQPEDTQKAILAVLERIEPFLEEIVKRLKQRGV